MNPGLKVTGRILPVSAQTRRLNPELYSVHPDMVNTTGPAIQSKRIRQDSKPLMNKLESEFKRYHESLTGHVLIPQALRFKLGNGIWFKPDFVQFCPNMGITAFEVKGPHAFRGGFENLKVAASLWPQVRWVLVWKESGSWKHQEILP
jgi:hypothetical protein